MTTSPFDDREGLVGRKHPGTSREAAAAVLPRTGTQRRKVYDHIAASGDDGATDLEIQQALEIGGNTERPRRVELVDAKLIVDSGRTRLAQGRHHVVWITTDTASRGNDVPPEITTLF